MKSRSSQAPPALTELLILPDGRILAHNLTAAMASLLSHLDPEDQPMRRRAGAWKAMEPAPSRPQAPNQPT